MSKLPPTLRTGVPGAGSLPGDVLPGLGFGGDVPRQTRGFNSPPSMEGQRVARIHPAQHLQHGFYLQSCKSLINFLEQPKVPAESANQLWWIKETYFKLLTAHSQTRGPWGGGGKGEVTHSSSSSGCHESSQHQAGAGQRCPLTPWRMLLFMGSSLPHQKTPTRHQCYAVHVGCLHLGDDGPFGNWMLVHIQPPPIPPSPSLFFQIHWFLKHLLEELIGCSRASQP